MNLKKLRLKRVFLLSSRSYVERILEQNIKTLLYQFEWGQNFRLTSNGKLVQKYQNEDGFVNRPYEMASRADFPPLISSTPAASGLPQGASISSVYDQTTDNRAGGVTL